jgi:hypothetical protein
MEIKVTIPLYYRDPTSRKEVYVKLDDVGDPKVADAILQREIKRLKSKIRRLQPHLIGKAIARVEAIATLLGLQERLEAELKLLAGPPEDPQWN